MRHFILSFLLILIATQAFTQNENKSIDSIMSSIYTKDRPGAAIAIVKNGEVVFKKGYGIANI
ncbi:MAG TPA: hypothetical protein VFE71_11830, partial [Bacteroidales bacterium]|nr:hypothetical protein [Bacteroidales bacterium]